LAATTSLASTLTTTPEAQVLLMREQKTKERACRS
jgi:hypothetical protein